MQENSFSIPAHASESVKNLTASASEMCDMGCVFPGIVMNDDQCCHLLLWYDRTATVCFEMQNELKCLGQVAMHAELRDIDATLGLAKW